MATTFCLQGLCTVHTLSLMKVSDIEKLQYDICEDMIIRFTIEYCKYLNHIILFIVKVSLYEDIKR